MTVPNKYTDNLARAVLYSFLYVFLGWLFLITKPSFMGSWPWLDRITALASVAIPPVLIAATIHSFLALLAAILSRLRLQRVSNALYRITPSLLATLIALMLLDNFSYTVFGWGVANHGETWAAAYWAFLLLFFIWHFSQDSTPLSKSRTLFTITLLVISICTPIFLYVTTSPFQERIFETTDKPSNLPNIIFFASDGIDASHLSAYGYSRKTSPNLDKYLKGALVMNNAYTNSSWTTGSLTSMMTGKYPATTKVMYPPYILDGKDAYQSLPAILKQLGYRSRQETVRYYADGPDLNWKNSFESANGRHVVNNVFNGLPLGLQKAVFLGFNLFSRLAERLAQIFFIKPMPDRYAEVAPGHDSVYGMTDALRMKRAIDLMTKGSRPFFVHIHLMGTHCCHFLPTKKVFSQGLFKNDKLKRIAQLDDTILQSDYWFGRMMDKLKERGLLNNTLIVYSSDHDTGWDFRKRIPLIIRFPTGHPSGEVKPISQLLDIAPTILDYLGVSIPSWMEGRSLLTHKLAKNFAIFSTYRLKRSHFRSGRSDVLARVSNMASPTFGLKKAGMVACNRWFILDLTQGTVNTGVSDQRTNNCPQKNYPSKAQAARLIRHHLFVRGFRISQVRD